LKVTIERPNNIHGTMIEGTGLVLGKPKISSEGHYVGIKNPRLARVIQVPGGGSDLVCVPIVGEPDFFHFLQAPSYIYEVKDKRVIDKYTESTSTIKVVKQMPPIIAGK
jgi:hypothetical protein